MNPWCETVHSQRPAMSKVKVTLCQHAPRLPASPSLITSQFQSLVVLLSGIVQKRVFMLYTVFPDLHYYKNKV